MSAFIFASGALTPTTSTEPMSASNSRYPADIAKRDSLPISVSPRTSRSFFPLGITISTNSLLLLNILKLKLKSNIFDLRLSLITSLLPSFLITGSFSLQLTYIPNSSPVLMIISKEDTSISMLSKASGVISL